MRATGLVLITAGFIIGAFAAVEAAEGVRWVLFAPAAVVGMIGVALARAGSRKESQAAHKITADLASLEKALGSITREVGELRQRQDEIGVYELRHEIDRRLPAHLGAFVDARESLAHRYGLQAYADLMSHFAAGERHINRVWCCSADGYIDEARAYLDYAAEQFGEVTDRLAALTDSSLP